VDFLCYLLKRLFLVVRLSSSKSFRLLFVEVVLFFAIAPVPDAAPSVPFALLADALLLDLTRLLFAILLAKLPNSCLLNLGEDEDADFLVEDVSFPAAVLFLAPVKLLLLALLANLLTSCLLNLVEGVAFFAVVLFLAFVISLLTMLFAILSNSCLLILAILFYLSFFNLLFDMNIKSHPL
jgi:hypothetical protein